MDEIHDNNSTLHKAAAMDDMDKVKKCIEAGEKVDFENSMGWTPLMMATRNGHVDIVKYLLENRADVTKCNNYGSGMLSIAVESGSKDMVHLILQYMLSGGISRQTIGKPISPIFLAISFGFLHILKYLTEQSFDIFSVDSSTGMTPAEFASFMSNTEAYNFLRSMGAEHNPPPPAVTVTVPPAPKSEPPKVVVQPAAEPEKPKQNAQNQHHQPQQEQLQHQQHYHQQQPQQYTLQHNYPPPPQSNKHMAKNANLPPLCLNHMHSMQDPFAMGNSPIAILISPVGSAPAFPFSPIMFNGNGNLTSEVIPTTTSATAMLTPIPPLTPMYVPSPPTPFNTPVEAATHHYRSRLSSNFNDSAIFHEPFGVSPIIAPMYNHFYAITPNHTSQYVSSPINTGAAFMYSSDMIDLHNRRLSAGGFENSY